VRVIDHQFVKGHGTANDFIVLPGPIPPASLTPDRVAWLCDRRRGIGADGVLLVARTGDVAEVAQFADVAPYFMDYRNADGSIAEMCGNGIRVFARFLDAAGLAEDDVFVIATRGGLMSIEVGSEEISVDMGAITQGPNAVTVRVNGTSCDAVAVHIPNPHAVAFVDSLENVGSLATAPEVQPAFADGGNVEFVERVSSGHLRMRVHERGVGETFSCGTGACAVAWVASAEEPGIRTWQVDVPGGTLWIDIDHDDHVHLRGPATLVARGTFQWPRDLAGG